MDAPSTAAGVVSTVDVAWKVPEAAFPAALDRQMFRRVLVNLVRNAVQAIRDARKGGALPLGHVQIGVRREGAASIVVVEDDGPGIDANLRDRIFEPYYTTKSDGTGLGLAIVKKIVVEHGGTIEIDQSPMGGARFTIRLPGPRSTEIAAIREARERAREAGVATGEAAP
jgi:signal transduction histidine kinase